jgi:Domain of unknown function (DUF1996)
MARRILLLAVLAALIAPVSSPSTVAGALSHRHHRGRQTGTRLGRMGSFAVKCRYVGSAPVDPIVAPGVRPSGHRHDFFGNRTISQFSTVSSMLAAFPDDASCSDPKDTAGYWLPSLYVDGRQRLPLATASPFTVYYTGVHLRNTPADAIHPPPRDLRLVAGHADARSGPFWHTELYWGCGHGSPLGGVTDHVPDCAGLPRPQHLELHVQFPECLAVDQRGDPVTDSPDHRRHAAYAVDGACPADHPYAIAQVVERVRWDVPPHLDRHRVTLSSGEWWTMHGDYWQTWDDQELRARFRRCFTPPRHCGTQHGTLT